MSGPGAPYLPSFGRCGKQCRPPLMPLLLPLAFAPVLVSAGVVLSEAKDPYTAESSAAAPRPFRPSPILHPHLLVEKTPVLQSTPAMPVHLMTIASNLEEIRERMAQAAHRAGRNPAEVALMAVSKTHPASAILEAHRRRANSLRRKPRAGVRRQARAAGPAGQPRKVPPHRPSAIQQSRARRRTLRRHRQPRLTSPRPAPQPGGRAARPQSRRPRRNQHRRRSGQGGHRSRLRTSCTRCWRRSPACPTLPSADS